MSFEPPDVPLHDRGPTLTMASYQVRPDHTVLLATVPDEGDGSATSTPCDAVVVLNHVHPERLGFGARLAASLRCRMLVLCTSDYRDGVTSTISGLAVRPPSIDVLSLPWPAAMPLDGLECTRHAGARSTKHRDVAAKRNVALAVARAMGWRRVLFLDDDVRGVSVTAVRAALWALRRPGVQAVGWTCRAYPDNSVVCHARRLVNLPQRTFVGAGALALKVAADLPMFPPIYNEDWLFLHDLVTERRVLLGGDARQLVFNPFEPHERAREEEFGDVLAEGLFHLLHEGVTDLGAADEAYWRHVVEVRRDLVHDLRTRLRATQRSRSRMTAAQRQRVAQALRALAAASSEHVEVDLAPALASFVSSWRRDREVWREWFASLQYVGDLTETLHHLQLSENCLVRR
jgi:hypothetical protein